jgi:transposase
MRKFPEKTISEIIKLYEKNKSSRKVGQLLNIGKSTVAKILRDKKIIPSNINVGRPRKISLRKEKYIVNLFDRGRFQSSTDGVKYLEDMYGLEVTPKTIRNILIKNGLKCYRKQKKCLLLKKHKNDRLHFVNMYSSFTFFEWKKVIFSDETKINLDGSDGNRKYWRKPSIPGNKYPYIENRKFGGGNIMSWGCITSEGVGKLVRIDSKMTAEKYISILEDGLIETLEKYNITFRDTIFMQDNDPKHTAKKTIEWIKYQGITLLSWPSNSPDLNPIENLWNMIKVRIYSRKKYFSNKDELWKIMEEEWYKIPSDYVKKLYISMTRRIHELFKAKGGHIKY